MVANRRFSLRPLVEAASGSGLESDSTYGSEPAAPGAITGILGHHVVGRSVRIGSSRPDERPLRGGSGTSSAEGPRVATADLASSWGLPRGQRRDDLIDDKTEVRSDSIMSFDPALQDMLSGASGR